MTKEQGKYVADFDGTFTEPNVKFRSAAIDFLAKHFGINTYEMETMFAASEKEIASRLQEHGPKRNGKIVAAPADIILFTQAAALHAIAAHSLEDKNFDDPEKVVYEMYSSVYPTTPAIFKEDARDCLKRLVDTGRLVVVTNSKTKDVQKMISLLNPNINVPVAGDAQKFEVTDTWTTAIVNGNRVEVPINKSIPGLSRPAYLRREKYYSVLKSLGAVLAILGDIHELDLVLASYLGIPTILVTSPHNPYTPPWDKELYAKGENKRFLAKSLTAAVDHVINLKDEPILLG